MLRARSDILRAIRDFFRAGDFIEVETPVRLPAPALELHIDAEPAGDWYLRTSPELHIKRLLAGGAARVFEMGPCFRRGEYGARHHAEYTMLEWYRLEADDRVVFEDAKALLAAVVETVTGGFTFRYGGQTVDCRASAWEVVTVSDLFRAHAGWDPVRAYDADRFDLDLVAKVEPALPRDRPVVVRDYPVEAAALARCRAGDVPVAERWELYLGGMELANAFTELTDAVEQRRRFEACAVARRAAGRPVYPLDEAFLAALAGGLRPCAGVALGVDRLVMLLTGVTDIGAVRPFAQRSL